MKPVEDEHGAPIDMSWAQFCRFLHETPDTDAHKITLLAIVVRSDGEPDQRVDVEGLMAALDRSRDTVIQTLNLLSTGSNPWLQRVPSWSPNNRPMVAWHTVRRIAA